MARPLAAILTVFGVGALSIGQFGGAAFFLPIALVCWLYARPDLRARIARRLATAAELPVVLGPASVPELHQHARNAGGGAYLALRPRPVDLRPAGGRWPGPRRPPRR